MFAKEIFSQDIKEPLESSFTSCDSPAVVGMCNLRLKTEGFTSLIPSGKMSVLKSLPSNYYFSQLGLICKKEVLFQKQTSIPLRLRLGSLDYTNYLEQKPNAIKPSF